VNVVIRLETPADLAAIHEVNRLAFGQDAEARLVDALRDGNFVRASLVAERDAGRRHYRGMGRGAAPEKER
jgi:putative acetyltransferase